MRFKTFIWHLKVLTIGTLTRNSKCEVQENLETEETIAVPTPLPLKLAHRKARGMSITYLEAIREAQAKALREDPRVYIYGQDVGAFGGAPAQNESEIASVPATVRRLRHDAPEFCNARIPPLRRWLCFLKQLACVFMHVREVASFAIHSLRYEVESRVADDGTKP